MQNYQLDDKLQKKVNFLIKFFYWAAILVIVYVIINYALSTLMPFLLAFLISAILRPLLRLMNEKLHIPQKLGALLLLLLTIALIGTLGVLLSIRLFDEVKELVSDVPGLWNNSILPALQEVEDWITNLLAQWNIEPTFSFDELLSDISSNIVSISSTLLNQMSNVVFSLPSALASTIICIISCYFILSDWDVIKDFIIEHLPKKTGGLFVTAWRELKKTIWKYIRSYGLIMLITFFELLIGLNIIRVDNAFALSICIAIFDILPIVGCGTVLIPWFIFSFICGDIGVGIGLAILYVVITIIRNYIEPRIIGHQVGLHPIVTLMAMVIGTSLFGFVGLIGLPVSIAVIKKLDDDGIIHVFSSQSE